MVVDPIEADADGQFQDGNSDANNYITTVESSDEWTAWRDNLAQEMWNNRAVH